jgi:AraC-like DNA-binding protein
MLNQNITMGADDYLAKPFNLQEAAMRFNKLLGIGPIEMDSHLIEGAETRVLEDRNSSMTTSTESNSGAIMAVNGQVTEDDQIRAVTVKSTRLQTLDSNEGTFDTGFDDSALSMTDVMDRQLINSIEQYVQQNMSRGQISLDEMATAMGMSMKPFFQKVREVTGRTPAEVVRDIRLKHACILLQRTNINMSELASNVGFVTGEYFINQFKERFGISPSEYRQRYRK